MAIREARSFPQLSSVPELLAPVARDPRDSSCDRNYERPVQLRHATLNLAVGIPRSQNPADGGDISSNSARRALCPSWAKAISLLRFMRLWWPMPNSSDRDRRFAVVDPKTRARIVAAYAEHGISVRLLTRRFGLSAVILRRVLIEGGITLRPYKRLSATPS